MLKALVKVGVWPLRAPLVAPIKTSLRLMTRRPAWLLSITDHERQKAKEPPCGKATGLQ